MASGEIVLLTSLGTYAYQNVDYHWNGRTLTTPYTPVALAHFRKPDRLVVLLTPEAREKHWESLQAELRRHGCPPAQLAEIPSGESEAEFWRIFDTVKRTVGEGSQVDLDITFGYRSLPFIYYAALSFLSGFRAVRLRGVFYGIYPDGLIVDLTPLIGVIEGYYAVRAFREAGDMGPAAAVLNGRLNTLFATGQAHSHLVGAVKALRRVAPPLAEGLPVEAGMRLGTAATRLQELDTGPGDGALAGFGDVLQLLRDELAPYAVPSAERTLKKRLQLTAGELARQLRLIRWYADKGRLSVARMLMREWLVNRVLFARGICTGWLDRTERARVEGRLNALAAAARRSGAGGGPAELATLWRQIADDRNPYAHGGFTPKPIDPDAAKVHDLLGRLFQLEGVDEFWQVPEPAVQRLLVTGLGTTPGALYSALLNNRPDRLLALVSPQTRPLLAQVLDRAGTPDLPVQVVELADPFSGFTAARARWGEIQAAVLDAAEVVCNLTGGTTLMQYLVEQAARFAEHLGLRPRRVAQIDYRDTEEQRRDPWRRGEQIDLGDEEPEADERA